MNLAFFHKSYTEDTSFRADSETLKEIDVDIVLGMPKNDCKYYGICKIETHKTLASRSNFTSLHTAEAKIRINKESYLEIRFKKDSLSAATKHKHFDDDYFRILESIVIPYFVSSYIGKSFIIRIGKYPIEDDGIYFKVVFA